MATTKKKSKKTTKQSPSPEKAREILHEGEVGGKPLTEKQRRFMGARASGQPPKPPKDK